MSLWTQGGGCVFTGSSAMLLSSEFLVVLISSVWHEGGAVAPPVWPRLQLCSALLSAPSWFSHTFLAALCHIDLNVSVEGNIINANSPAVHPANKTCLIHQADIAIKTTLSPSLPSLPPHSPPSSPPFPLILLPSLLRHFGFFSSYFSLFTFVCPEILSLNHFEDFFFLLYLWSNSCFA